MTHLLHQSTIPTESYFVLQGCVRQYGVDEFGKDTTVQLYTTNNV
ncbi:MAG: hypothetical protein ACRCWQ_07360 [Bacilli bacterium]